MPYHEEDEWDENNRNQAKQHPLSIQLEEVSETLNALFAYPKNESEMINSHIQLIRESLNLIKAKLYSALRSDSYLVCMQNAAIIRNHGDYLLVAPHALNFLDSFDKSHVSVFHQEMEHFQELFKAWVQEIKAMDREDLEDEWGLF